VPRCLLQWPVAMATPNCHNSFRLDHGQVCRASPVCGNKNGIGKTFCVIWCNLILRWQHHSSHLSRSVMISLFQYPASHNSTYSQACDCFPKVMNISSSMTTDLKRCESNRVSI
jgi:hypothetical protein